MESRKYQLQKQILEALESNDDDLYALLKSQWAHRFGVESLEELKNLDLKQLNQKINILNNQKTDQSQEKLFEVNQSIPKEGDNQEKEIKSKKSGGSNDSNDKSSKTKSYEIESEGNDMSKAKNSFKYNKMQSEIEVLIPLPPKPKYSYLKKWLIRR